MTGLRSAQRAAELASFVLDGELSDLLEREREHIVAGQGREHDGALRVERRLGQRPVMTRSSSKVPISAAVRVYSMRGLSIMTLLPDTLPSPTCSLR